MGNLPKEVIKEFAGFTTLAPRLDGAQPLRAIKRGRAVSVGELLARHPDPWRGDVHAPCSGFITEINEFEIIIERDDTAEGRPPLPRELENLSPPNLAAAFKDLGLDIFSLGGDAPLIINTLNAEPGISYSAALFSEHWETMQAGIKALSSLYPSRQIIWASAKYPASAQVLDGRDLYFWGRLWRTGLPITRMVISLGGSNYFVPVGSRVSDLLRFANLYPHADEVVVEGGLITGRSLSRLDNGLGKNAAALNLLKGAGRPAALRQLRDGPFIKPSLWGRLRGVFKSAPKKTTALNQPNKTVRPGKAFLKCGHQGEAVRLAEYQNPAPTCAGANFHDGGPLLCPYGCLAYGDCARACPQQAITMRQGFPYLEPALCTACGECQKVCPKNLFEILVAGSKIFIPCAAKSGLKQNAGYCPKACLGCGFCRRACQKGAIFRPEAFGAMTVNQNICQTFYENCEKNCRRACPRGLLASGPKVS
jgi:ferredoxin